MHPRLITLDGAVETAIRLGVADAIADVVETGTTLRQAGLELFGEPILQSEAVLIRRRGAESPTGLDLLQRRLNGVLVARNYVMMDYDVSDEVIDSGLHHHPWVRVADGGAAGQGGLAGRPGHGAPGRGAEDHGRPLGDRRPGDPGHRHRGLSDLMSPSEQSQAATDPNQPVAYRSNRLRFFVMIAALGLVALSFVFWVALPANLKAEFTLSQAVTLLLILGVFVFALLIVGNGVVKADADGLYIRNGLSRHSYAWARIHRVVMRPGDAWAQVLIIPTDRPVEVAADLDHRMLMGIQKGDGPYATEAVEDLNRRVKASREQRRP